jgi:hypothetical protein
MITEQQEIIESAPSETDDDFWLDQGKKMVEGSLASVREAAKSLLTGLGVLQGIYLGILGFAEFIPKTMPILQKSLFIIPLLCWLMALYQSLQVMMTLVFNVHLHSPDDIRMMSDTMLKEKQGKLKWAFWFLTLGLVMAFVLMVHRLSL